MCVLFFNLHYRVIFFPQCQVFTLHVLEYLFHLLKCYVSQMAFCSYYRFSVIVVLHAACHQWKGTLGSLLREQRDPDSSSSFVLRPAFPFPGQRTAWGGTVNVPYIRWQCAPLLWAGIFRRDPSAREFGRKRRAF